MRKVALFSVLLVTFALAARIAGAAQTQAPDTSGTVFVTERQIGSVTAFDGETGKPIWTSKTGTTPIGVVKPRGTGKVYTSDEGSNQMSVFDARTGAPLRTIPMGNGPHHLMATGNGKLIYVAEFLQNTVGVVDTSTDAEIAHLEANPLPEARTHAVFITQNGKDLYATDTRADRTQQGDVAHIDASTGERLCNTMVGVDPSEILVTANGKIGYVTVRGENKVKELDLSGRCPLLTGREAIVGTAPDTMQLRGGTFAGKRTLVVALRGQPAQISLLDLETFTADLVDIPGHTTTGHHWLSRRGEFTFVAVESPAGLAVVNNDTGDVVADYLYPDPPGGTRAHGVFYAPKETTP
jgi:DNA-binding beta-propeller fold protein YncE